MGCLAACNGPSESVTYNVMFSKRPLGFEVGMTKAPPVKIVVTSLTDDALWTTTKLRPGDTVARVGPRPDNWSSESDTPDAAALLKLLSSSPVPFSALFVKPPLPPGKKRRSSSDSSIVTYGSDGRALSWLDRLPAKKGRPRPGDRALNPRFQRIKELFPDDKWTVYKPSPKSMKRRQERVRQQSEEEFMDLNSYLNQNPDAELTTSIIKASPPVRKSSNAEELMRRLPLPMRPSVSDEEEISDILAFETAADPLVFQPNVVTVDDEEPAPEFEHSFATVQTISVLHCQSSDPSRPRDDELPQVVSPSPCSRGDEIEDSNFADRSWGKALGTFVPRAQIHCSTAGFEHTMNEPSFSETYNTEMELPSVVEVAQDVAPGGQANEMDKRLEPLHEVLEPLHEVEEPPTPTVAGSLATSSRTANLRQGQPENQPPDRSAADDQGLLTIDKNVESLI